MPAEPKRLLITGASGFVGRYVVATFQRKPDWIVGTLHRTIQRDVSNIKNSYHIDLANADLLKACLREFRPTHIIHLAAQASVGNAIGAAVETWRSNVVGLFNLGDAILADAPDACLLLVSSSEVYGKAFLSKVALTEEAYPLPVESYACSKHAGEQMLLHLFAGRKNRLIILRPFNHIGPGQSENFVISSFAAQIARMEAGLSPRVLRVGNLNASRDFLDVRDVVSAYELIISKSDQLRSCTVLNIASGITRTIESILDELIRAACTRFDICHAADRLRPAEIPIAIGDATRLRLSTGWAPRIPWDETIAAILDDARLRVSTHNPK